MESKRAKMAEEEKEDRISDLPDSLIHHILSLLPSTKDSVRTGILSKRWQNQWTRVPVLIFNSTTFGIFPDNFFQFVDNSLILHECSKINKFHLVYSYTNYYDPKFSSKLRFATRKGVEDLYLWLNYEYMLPKFLFEHASLVTLTTANCSYMPNGNVNWECLTTLSMTSCRLADQVMELILSGSPLLETMFLGSCIGFNKLVIASKSLKKLHLQEFRSIFYIEISCPSLERLILHHCLNVRTAKLLNLPSSLFGSIDFNHHEDECNESRMSLIKDILNQLRHVKHLIIGSWFIENMASAIQVGGQFSPVFNIKILALKSCNASVIAWLLRNSPVLEELVITVPLHDQAYEEFGENHWSDATFFNGLLSHLKTIKIIGFPRRDEKRKGMLNFVQFLFKNARVLQKMIVYFKDDGTDFPLKVSQELLSLLRCSRLIESYTRMEVKITKMFSIWHYIELSWCARSK